MSAYHYCSVPKTGSQVLSVAGHSSVCPVFVVRNILELVHKLSTSNELHTCNGNCEL